MSPKTLQKACCVPQSPRVNPAESYNTAETATFKPRFSTPENWCWPANRLPGKQVWLQAFPFQQFHVLLTLFPKCFSSFPHGTCSLSVSRQYLALDETYHPFRAAIPNNSTLWTCIVRDRLQVKHGILTLADAFFQRTYTWAIADHTSLGYNS